MNKIVQSNANYKLQADVRKRLKTFNVGDFVMIQICLERFPPGTVKKLHARSAAPFQILIYNRSSLRFWYQFYI